MRVKTGRDYWQEKCSSQRKQHWARLVGCCRRSHTALCRQEALRLWETGWAPGHSCKVLASQGCWPAPASLPYGLKGCVSPPATWELALRLSVNEQGPCFCPWHHIKVGFVYVNYLTYKVMEFYWNLGENKGLCSHITLRNFTHDMADRLPLKHQCLPQLSVCFPGKQTHLSTLQALYQPPYSPKDVPSFCFP